MAYANDVHKRKLIALPFWVLLQFASVIGLAGWGAAYAAEVDEVDDFGDGRANLVQVKKMILPSALVWCEEYQSNSQNQCNWNFRVKQSSEINAYAHGFGQITILSGLLDSWGKSEEELAFVIAHELAHHIAGHIEGTQARVSKSSLVGIALGALAANEKDTEDDKLEAFSESVEVASAIGSLLYSKAQEAEADHIALRMINDAGYDLSKVRPLLVKMSLTGARASKFLETHPSGAERLQAFDSVVAKLPSRKKLRRTKPPIGFEYAKFEYIAGSYCVYSTSVGKKPFPKVEGCAAEKLIKVD